MGLANASRGDSDSKKDCRDGKPISLGIGHRHRERGAQPNRRHDKTADKHPSHARFARLVVSVRVSEIANIDINARRQCAHNLHPNSHPLSTTSVAGLSTEIHDHDDYTSNDPGAVTPAPNGATKGAIMAI